MMLRFFFKLLLLSPLFLIFFWMTVAPSEAFQTTDEEKMYQGIKYACTGVGESKEDPRWAGYPVKLMFTTGGTAYVAYVQVKIKDNSGKLVFEADCDSPWLLVALKPGSYQVAATALKKYTKRTTLKVVSGKQTSLAIRFPEISGGME